MRKIRTTTFILAVALLVLPQIAFASGDIYNVKVTYYRQDKVAGGRVTYSSYQASDIATMEVPLFQIHDDRQGIRSSDGWVYTCQTDIDLQGVTANNSVKITFGNPVTYNMKSQTLTGAYNRIAVTVTYNNGQQTIYEGKTGEVNSLGNIGLYEMGDIGTVSYSNEIVLTMFEGLAIDSVRVAIGLYVDTDNPVPIPMSWWKYGGFEIGNISNVEEYLEQISSNQSVIINQMNKVTNMPNEDRVDVDNMQNNVADRQEQSGQLVEDSKVNKPTISDDVLNPMDRVDGTALNEMGGLIGAIFTSPTLGSIATMTLVFALIGYIMYGKKG